MKGIFMNINPKSLSLEESLLLSALICGVTPENPAIHRLQLFYCTNFIIGKDNAEEDFQRCIETEVKRHGSAKSWNRSDRAIYELTPQGYDRATRLFPDVSPRFSPANNIEIVGYKLVGKYNNEVIIFERHGRKIEARIGNEFFTNMEDACHSLGFSTENRSAARVLYNLAVRNGFEAADARN